MTAPEIDVAIGLAYAHDGRETYKSQTYFVPKGAALLSYRIAARMADGSMAVLVNMTFEGSSIIARFNDEDRAAAFREGREFERRRLRRRLRKVLGL